MDAEELLETHDTYADRISDWTFWGLAYSGGTRFIDFALQKHIRESDSNWENRQDEGVCFNYSSIVIDLFNFYLTEKPALRELGPLVKDTLWQLFIKDADLYGTNFDVFLNESQKLAAIYGAVGILIDKPKSTNEIVREDIRDRVYPYCASFTLPNILDWKHERDPVTNRPTLTYLKLFDYDNRYLLWWRDRWEVWAIPENTTGGMRIHKHTDTSNYQPRPGSNKYAAHPGKVTSALTSTEDPIMVDQGDNPLGEIPFLWFQNIKNIEDPYIGESDIKEISRISASIIRNVSYGEEVIKFAGFPQARRPMAREGEDINNEAGVTAILEFDPSLGEAGKPDWLEAAVNEPVGAILNWINKKVEETFQLAHLSGLNAQRTSGSAVRSGIAMRYEYQQLGLVLGKKSSNLTETELGIIKYWLKWQKSEKDFDQIKISRSADFSIDDLSQNLENSIMADRLIPELTFKKELMKVVAKKVLPDVPDSKIEEIHNAIDALTEKDILMDGNETDNRSTKDIRQNTAGVKNTGVEEPADPSKKGVMDNIKGSSRQLDGKDSRGENKDR
jgi:hypothetical protein